MGNGSTNALTINTDYSVGELTAAAVTRLGSVTK